jgi:hypothetical protein
MVRLLSRPVMALTFDTNHFTVSKWTKKMLLLVEPARAAPFETGKFETGR